MTHKGGGREPEVGGVPLTPEVGEEFVSLCVCMYVCVCVCDNQHSIWCSQLNNVFPGTSDTEPDSNAHQHSLKKRRYELTREGQR